MSHDNMKYEWAGDEDEGSGVEIFSHSSFMKWLAGENAAGRARFRRLKTRSGKPALEVNLSMAAARRFSIGDINGQPFIGVQPGDLSAIAEVPWTHSEARLSFAAASLTLCGRAENGLPIRLSIPANPEAFKHFIRKGARLIHVRRVVVAPHGRVTRVARKPIRALKLIRRGQIRRTGRRRMQREPIAAGRNRMGNHKGIMGRFRWMVQK